MSRGIIRSGGGIRTCRLAAPVVNSAIAAPTDATGMAWDLLAGRYYIFRWMATFQSTNAATAVGFTTSGPAYDRSHWWGNIRNGSTGADMMWQAESTTLGTLIGQLVPIADTDYLAILEGYCKPSANGTLQLRVRTETDATAVSIQDGVGELIDAT